MNFIFMYIQTAEQDKIGPYTFPEFISLNQTEMLDFVDKENILVFTKDSQRYLLNKDLLIQADNLRMNKTKTIVLFDDAPAIRSNISGAIQNIDGNKIEKIEGIEEILKNITLETM